MKRLTLFCLALGLAASGLPASGGTDEEQVIPLEKILRYPQAFKRLTVTFIAQFHELGTLENPVYTKFDGEWYQNFSVWPDSAQLWKAEDYRNDFQYCFIRRLSEGAKTLVQAPRFSRWIITGEIVEVALGKPWLEVSGLRQLETSFDEASLKHLVTGFRLTRLGQDTRAAAEFRLTDRPTLPINVRTLVMREEASALRRAGQDSLAYQRLLVADEILPNSPATLEALMVCRDALGLDENGNPIIVTGETEGTPVDVITPQPSPWPTPTPVTGETHTKKTQAQPNPTDSGWTPAPGHQNTEAAPNTGIGAPAQKKANATSTTNPVLETEAEVVPQPRIVEDVSVPAVPQPPRPSSTGTRQVEPIEVTPGSTATNSGQNSGIKPHPLLEETQSTGQQTERQVGGIKVPPPPKPVQKVTIDLVPPAVKAGTGTKN